MTFESNESFFVEWSFIFFARPKRTLSLSNSKAFNFFNIKKTSSNDDDDGIDDDGDDNVTASLEVLSSN